MDSQMINTPKINPINAFSSGNSAKIFPDTNNCMRLPSSTSQPASKPIVLMIFTGM